MGFKETLNKIFRREVKIVKIEPVQGEDGLVNVITDVIAPDGKPVVIRKAVGIEPKEDKDAFSS